MNTRGLTQEQEDEERHRMYRELGELFAKWKSEGVEASTISGRLIGMALVTAECVGITFEQCVDLVKHHYGMSAVERPKAKA